MGALTDCSSSFRELRDVMRQKPGPADLRNTTLNRDQDVRQQMRPKPGPSDLRFSHLNPNRDMRELMTSTTLREAEKANDSERLANDLAESIIKNSAELESSCKDRERIIKRLRARINDTELQKDDSTEEGEVEPSETSEDIVEPTEDELTGVLYSETDNADSTPLP